MIKEAYFRGLMKVAMTPQQQAQAKKQLAQKRKDEALTLCNDVYASTLSTHGFYKGTPIAQRLKNESGAGTPADLRHFQADDSASKFSDPSKDHVGYILRDYYQKIGRQNRDFYLKQGFRPPKDHKYKTPFPFPNHPKKKQMMEQNQHQVRNTRGAQDYSGHA